MISLTAAGLEDLEQERRVLGAQAEQLKRNGVSLRITPADAVRRGNAHAANADGSCADRTGAPVSRS